MSSISILNKTLNEEKMKFHDELNPAIWEGNKLKDKVAMKLMEIASNFVAYLDTEGFVVEDIIITGSMANYNYTEQSDIDLHIICDYAKLPTNCPILSQEYFQAKKKIYNDKHNIKIYGYDVELYVEDSTAPSLAGGKYSLLQGKWLRFPQKIDFEVEDVVGTEELQDLITQVENVCMTDGNIEEANELLNHIYEMRKTGLANNGEFAFENLLFKALRNRGYLDKLRSYIANAEDLSLSLNESIRVCDEDKKVANESFNKAGEQPKNLTESWSDVDDFLDIQEETRPYDVLMMYKSGENNIWYPLIKPTEYKQALNEFMKYGEIVRYPEDKIYNWLKIIFKNTCLIDSITQLAGHTEWFPYDEVKDAYEETEDLPENWNDFSSFLEEQGFYDWCKLPDGSDAWSDYGLKPLYNILNEYNDSMNAGQVLVLINRCLDVYHQRGDLASAFIDGGSASLTKISNESKLIKGKQLNESIMFNDEVYDDFQEEYRKLTVWVNPSIDWIRNKLEEAGGFRFLHSIDKNKLYVFTVESGFMHQQVFDMLDFDWSKDGRNVVGVFNPDNSISIWEALADDGEASSSLKLAEELDDDLFKKIYPNGYELTICY